MTGTLEKNDKIKILRELLLHIFLFHCSNERGHNTRIRKQYPIGSAVFYCALFWKERF